MQDAPVALITGAAIRVGAVIARELADAGYRVWIHYGRSREAAGELHRALAPQALGPLGADLSDPEARSKICARVLDPAGPAAGRLDLLVNNAASFEHGPFLERTDADLERVLATNLVAPIALCRTLAPALARAPGPQRGNIVNILDLGALHPWREYLDHCVAKSGLQMATRALAVELAPAVRVNAIAPGTILWPPGPEYEPGAPARDSILEAIPLGEIGDPSQVARLISTFVDTPHLNGQILALDGGRSANFGR